MSRGSVDADLVVVGGGAAGLGAVRGARRAGAAVALVERGRLGGDCTWTGCVPSKALIERADAVHWGRARGLVGEVDTAPVMAEVRAAMATVGQDESQETLEAQGVQVVLGDARFTGPREVTVDGTAVRAGRAVVIATGSAPVVPPIDGLDTVDVLTNETVFELERLPASMAVLGGGPIGLELAQATARLGCRVTVLEADRLVSKEEPEVADVLSAVLRRDGVDVRTGVRVTGVATGGEGVVVTLDDRETVTAERLLVAVGRRPVTDGLDLGRIGLEPGSRGELAVDAKLRTGVDGVFAVGDVTLLLPFTHAADEMGSVAAANALGRATRSFSAATVPWVTFTDPEVGRVGMTEAAAHAAHGEAARVAFLPMADTDRGRVTGRTEGFVKLVTGPRGPLRHVAGGLLLGATVVCPTGGDVVHEVSVAMRSGAFAGRLAQSVHAYPSWSLAVRECAAQLFFAHRGREARPARPGP